MIRLSEDDKEVLAAVADSAQWVSLRKLFQVLQRNMELNLLKCRLDDGGAELLRARCRLDGAKELIIGVEKHMTQIKKEI